MTDKFHNTACAMAHMGIWSMERLTFEQLSSLYLSQNITLANQGERSTGEMETKQLDSGVLIVPISGVIMRKASSFGGTSTIRLKKILKDAQADSSVKGVLLHIDSPGGHTDGLFEAAEIIKEFNAAKPMISHVDGLMASAAYWLGSQVSKINASPMATIGSLGTLMTVTDFSEAFEKQGIKVHVLSTGKFKGMGEPGSEITKDQLAFLQNRVNEINEFFMAAVEEGRGLDRKTVEGLFDGSFDLAKTALEKNLIDDIKMFEESVAELENQITQSESGEGDSTPDESGEVIDLDSLEDGSVASVLPSATMDSEIKQNSSDKETEEMEEIKNVAELEAKYPLLVTEIKNSAASSAKENALKAETTRVKGWLEFIDVDAKAVADGIEKGEEITVSQATSLAVQRNNEGFKNKLEEENADDVQTPENENNEDKSAEDMEVDAIVAAAEKLS